MKHKRQTIFVEDFFAGLDVEEKARTKDAAQRAPEGQSSANMMQHAGKKVQKGKGKAVHTTQFKKKKMDMDEAICFVCGENGHFAKKCKNRKGKKNQGPKSSNMAIGDPSRLSTLIITKYIFCMSI